MVDDSETSDKISDLGDKLSELENAFLGIKRL